MIHNISRFIAALALLATAQGAWADTETVSYIDADGNAQTVTATVLTGNEESSQWGSIDLAAGWYVVKGDISYTNQINYINPTGTIHIILADGAQMSIEYNGDAAISLNSYHPLAIYGQSAGTGRLSVTSDQIAISAIGGITINGGIVSATSTGYGRPAISANKGAITINGGQVTATPGDNVKGISTEGTITLGLRSTFDFITANGYYGTVNIKDGQTLYDQSGNAYTGNGVSIPANATLRSWSPDDFSVNDAGTEYTIHTATGWNVFCDLLAENTKGYFSGKTVHLGADITVTRMAGGQPFTGTFDGQNHTLTLAYGTADAPIDAQFVAPFIETSADGEHQPTFSNLIIGGTIYDGYTGSEAHNVGGLIGHLYGTVTIERCTSLVEIHAKGGAGGFVGLCEHSVSFSDCHSAAVVRSAGGNNSGFVAWSRSSAYTINFTGCLFDGKLLQQNGTGDSNGGFIGWKGDAKTVNITNCLCAPAPLADGETMASSNSATFSREHSNYAATITNCYYTAAFDIAQGKATHTVTAGTDVTIKAIALTGTATQYTVSGITAYSGGGLQRGETLYYGSGDQLSLTLSKSATGAPRGYLYDGYTASAGTLSGTTLTMPDADVTISVNTAALLSDGQQHEVSYMTADGTTKTAKAIALDGHEAVDGDGYLRLDEGTYYVGTDIAYANEIRPGGNITLILADRKTMTLASDVMGINRGNNLTIYGQSLDAATAGTLRYDGTADGITANNYEQLSGNVRITTTGSGVRGIGACVTLQGGTLTISADGNSARAINGIMHSILGGQLTANATGAGATGIRASASSGTALTLGWTNPADRITVSSIGTPNGGTVAVKDGQALTDGSGHIYTGTLTADDLTAISGQTLRPCLALADAADNTAAIDDHASQTLAVALSGRTLYKDGSWNTLCLPFDISTASGTLSGDNVQAMTLNTTTSSLTDGTLTLNFDAATTIPAGTPFIIKWDNTGVNITNPVFMGVTVSNATNDATVEGVLTFTGTYAPVSIAAGGDNTKLYLGAANKLYYPTKAMTIGTHRAYFQLSDGITAAEPTSPQQAGVRAFVLNFGNDEATGIITVHDSGFMVNGFDAWYTLDGRRLDGQPTAKGLYIHGGKKVKKVIVK